jgi:urease accessory protein
MLQPHTITTEAQPVAGLLKLIWLASPALPVGGFSYSEALESAIDEGWVHNEASAGQWLIDQLYLTQARSDLVVLSAAVQAWRQPDFQELSELNQWVLQSRESSELRLQTEQMGRSMVEWMRNAPEIDSRLLKQFDQWAAISWPVAQALALSQSKADLGDALQAAAFGWAENMVQAAIKSVPLGQLAGQRILAALANEIPSAVDQAMTTPTPMRQSFSPMLAILSSRHEHLYSRLFRS